MHGMWVAVNVADVLRSRLTMLAAAAEAYRHAHTQLRFSCIMCLDVAAVGLMEAAAQRCRDSSSLFPEHRYGTEAGCWQKHWMPQRMHAAAIVLMQSPCNKIVTCNQATP